MISITVYAGAREIGGNKILLEDHPGRPGDDTALFFDFGTSYSRRGRYFEEFLAPRAALGLLDVLATAVIPPLEGVYREDLVPFPDFWDRFRDRPDYRRLERIDGVLLSHAHMDHVGAVSFLRTDIPMCCSAMTAAVMKAVQDSGQGGLESECCYATPRVLKEDVLVAASASEAPYVPRPFVLAGLDAVPPPFAEFWTRPPTQQRELTASVRAEREPRVGRLRARPFPVDHSIYGATAWAVETSAGWVVYTGDLRFHGGRWGDSEAFVQAAAALRPRVLICEGTRLGRDDSVVEGRAVTEGDVAERALAEVRGEAGLVVADFGPRNVERLQMFLDVARASGRRLSVLAKDAYLLEAMRRIDPTVPGVADCGDLLLWDDPKSRRDRWERDIRALCESTLVSAADIASAPGEHLLSMSFWDIKNLIDVRPQGGRYLYSSSEVYGEEAAADMRRLHNWLDLFGMTGVGLPEETPDGWVVPEGQRGLHASGHASAADIFGLVRDIRPQTVVPVHTECPDALVEQLRGSGIEVLLPEDGAAMVLE